MGALSLALLLGGVNAACINFRPAPAPIAAALSAGRAGAGVDHPGRAPVHRAGSAWTAARSTVQAWTGRCTPSTWRAGRCSGPSGSRASSPAGCCVSGDTLYAASSRPRGPSLRARPRAPAAGTGRCDRPGRRSSRPRRAARSIVADAAGRRSRPRCPHAASGGGAASSGISRVAPVPAGKGAVVVATVDSLFRLTADRRRGDAPDAVARRRAVALDPVRRVPGGGHHRLAGRRDRPGGPHDRAGASGWTHRCSARRRRPATRCTSPPGAARCIACRPVPRAGPSGWWRSSGRSRRRSPSSTGRSSSAAPTDRSARSSPDGARRGGSSSGARSSWDRCALDDGIVAVGGEGDLHRYRR